MRKSEEWIGHRHGSLTIESFLGLRHFNRGKAAVFAFRCDCGNLIEAQKSNVLHGKKMDSGCTTEVRWTAPHGASSMPLYKTWQHMLQRCYNPAVKSFADYGARGIGVCDRWRFGEHPMTGYECFAADMGEKPHPSLTIERLDNSIGYQPDNCVWETKQRQGKNRDVVRQITLGGVTRTLPEWCAITGVKYWTAYRRLKAGWHPERAVNPKLAR
jgi:hypothetical protein